jgi:hypothetical protein
MSAFPPDCTKLVTLFHLDGASGKESYSVSADVTTSGAFLPMDTKTHVLEGGDYVDPFELYLDPSVDVRVGDKCVIDGVEYRIKRVWDASYFGHLRHQRVSLSRATHA